MPTISANCRSASSRRSSLPSPQPRSRTRVAPDAFRAPKTASSRRSLRLMRPFDRRLLLVLLHGRRFFVGLVLRCETRHRVTHEASLMREVARHDDLARRMALEPALAMTKELLHFVVADPVVLAIVDNGYEHVEVCQQVAEAAGGAQRDGEQSARPERRHAVVEFMAAGFDPVAERLEERAEERFPATARDRRESRLEWQRGSREFGLALAPTVRS